eukprot:11493729-Alexandrium_andersonii.AAC.1
MCIRDRTCVSRRTGTRPGGWSTAMTFGETPRWTLLAGRSGRPWRTAAPPGWRSTGGLPSARRPAPRPARGRLWTRPPSGSPAGPSPS